MENCDDIWTRTVLSFQKEEGPADQESDTARRRQAALDGIDKNRSVNDHESRFMRSQTFPINYRSCIPEEAPGVSPAFNDLKTVSLSDLILGKRHRGGVLHGRLCAIPFKLWSGAAAVSVRENSTLSLSPTTFRCLCVLTVVEDSYGHGVCMEIQNAVESKVSSKEVKLRFPIGMNVSIIEPFFKLNMEGRAFIQVDHPGHILLDESNHIARHHLRLNRIDEANAIAEYLDGVKAEGNRMFLAQNFTGAVMKYSLCIEAYQSIKTMDVWKAADRKTAGTINKLVMLAHSNRAEVKLHLKNYDDALSDAEKALEMDSNHLKTLVRKGRAAHELGLYEMSSELFKSALNQSPKHPTLLKNLKESLNCNSQSKTGNYDLSVYNSGGTVPFCADFLGAVEIRRAKYGCGQRGLFATRRIEVGAVVLVSNPLGAGFFTPFLPSDRSVLDMLKGDGDSENFHMLYEGTIIPEHAYDLLVKLIEWTMRSKRNSAQLYCLPGKDVHETEIPSMELFRPGSQWAPTSTDKLHVDVGHIVSVIKKTSFTATPGAFHQLKKRLEKGDEDDAVEYSWAMYGLASFLNHSCAPNCWGVNVGKSIFFYALRDIAEGEELTTSYIRNPFFDGRETRRAELALRFSFDCNCDRCQTEKSYEPQISFLSAHVSMLASKARAEGWSSSFERRATKELASLGDHVEKIIFAETQQDLPCARKQNWLRSLFLDVYIAKYRLAAAAQQNDEKIKALQLIVETMSSLCATPEALEIAALLLHEIGTRYPKSSETLRTTMKEVRGIFRAAGADVDDKTFKKFITSVAKAFDINRFWHRYCLD